MPVSSFGKREVTDSGTIVMWDGLLSDIPSGWVLCDGNNGTPNLLDRFARQVPDGTTDPGGTGGAHSYSLAQGQLPSHSHSGSTSSDGSHFHTQEIEGTNAIDYNWGHPGSDTATTTVTGAHSHSGSTDNTGSGSSIDNRPKAYQVAYIMKV